MSSDDTRSDKLNSLFPHKVCINLDRRPERWERMKERFAEQGIGSVVRFPAFDGLRMNVPEAWPYTPGHYGCLQSHLAVLRSAQKNAYPNLLIFEDDCVFDPEFNQKFPRYMEQLPGDWDMLLFGGRHFEDPVQVSDNVARAKMTYLTHAYALNRRTYDALIELCEPGLLAIDDYTAELQKDFNCYCFVPDLIWQERLDSDTRPG
ncbi:MAG TPA: glycosyltransferase family 25 protein [Blastocatellia bacterium]|nr:glycosyltransferase family 25 protein [Blastocatellia bacterium]